MDQLMEVVQYGVKLQHLHEKMDHLLINQWQRLLEIQEVQTELMEEVARKRS